MNRLRGGRLRRRSLLAAHPSSSKPQHDLVTSVLWLGAFRESASAPSSRGRHDESREFGSASRPAPIGDRCLHAGAGDRAPLARLVRLRPRRRRRLCDLSPRRPAVLDGHSPYVRPTFKLLAANDRFVYPTPFALPFVPFAVAPEKVAALGFLDPLGCGGARLDLAARSPRLALLRRRAAWPTRVRSARRRLDRSLPPAAVRARLAFPRPHSRGRAARARGGGEAVSLAAPRLAARHSSVSCLRGVASRRSEQRSRSGPASIPEGCAAICRRSGFSTTSSGGSRTRSRASSISLHASAFTSEVVAGARRSPLSSAVCVLLRRRGDRVTFAAAVVAALIATPILWTHYLVLLLAPYRAHTSAARPALAASTRASGRHPTRSLSASSWRIVLVLAVLGVVAFKTVRRAELP